MAIALPKSVTRRPVKRVSRKKWTGTTPRPAPYSLLDRTKPRADGNRSYTTPRRAVKRLNRQAAAGRRDRAAYRKGKPVKTGGGNLQVRLAGGRGVTLTPAQYRSALAHAQLDVASRANLYRRNPQLRNDSLRRNTSPDLRVAGLDVSAAARAADRGVFPAANPGLRVLKAPYEVVRAGVEDPKHVSLNTVKGLRDMVVGLPSAVVQSVKDPLAIPKQLEKDYSRRYGDLARGDSAAFRKRIKKEGAAGEILDTVAAVNAGGKLAGIGGRAAGVKALTEPRPALRVSGGTVREQKLSRNAVTAVGQRRLDKVRVRRTVRAHQRADRTGGRLPALDASLQPGEIAPLRRSSKQARAVAVRKSRGVGAMKGEQAREVHRGAARAVARLNPAEARAFKYAMQLGIPADAKKATAVLRLRRAQITAARASEGTRIPKALAKTNDELVTIDKLLEAPAEAFTPRLRAVVQAERARGIRVAATDPGLDTGQRLSRRYTPVGEALGITRQEGESAAKFTRRVQVALERHGLDKPAYFKSAKRPSMRFGDYALGGSKAVAGDKQYTGALYRTGREDARTQVHVDSVAANIKRKHNWNTVADNFDAHAFDWGKNKTIGQLQDELDRRNINHEDVAFWNPRKYREARKAYGDPREEVRGDDVAPPGLDQAVDDAALDSKGLATKPEDFKNSAGWTVVPKAVYDEIHADTRPSGKYARSWDVLKAKQSRVLLGTSPPWAAYQVGSNALLAGLAKTGPIDAVKAQLWWNKLDPKLREAVEPYVGTGPYQGDIAQPKLGAATNNRLVNGYRAFKDTPIMRKAGKVNPLDLVFRFDNAQNNIFRRSVLYSQAKRDAYRRMGEDVGHVAALQERTHGILGLGPKKQIEAVLRDQKALEDHAAYVNRWLGDYQTYTAKERRILGRSVMFYGFLRYSLNFTFHTMPMHHPTMTALVGSLAKMQTDEVRKLLGGDELPFAMGRLYFTKNGKLQSVDLARLNPATNVFTDALSKADIGTFLGVLPPMVSTAFDLAYGKSSFTGNPLKVQGENTGTANERNATGQRIGLSDDARIALNRLGSLFFPYRVAGKVAAKGQPQGDDSLPFSLRPTLYKRADIVASLDKRRAQEEKRGVGGTIVQELAPFLPRQSEDPALAKSIRDRRTALAGKGSSSGGAKNPRQALKSLKRVGGGVSPRDALKSISR